MDQKQRMLARADRLFRDGRDEEGKKVYALAQQQIIPWGPVRTHGPEDVR